MKILYSKLLFLLLINYCVFSPAFAHALSTHFDFASNKYQVPKELLMAIAKTESNFNLWAINVRGKSYFPKSKAEALRIAKDAFQKRKSFDVGLMQINVWWLKKYNISLETALEPQNNIILGAFILKYEISRHGLNWKAVASYHTPVSKNPQRGKRYASMVIRNLRLIGDQ